LFYLFTVFNEKRFWIDGYYFGVWLFADRTRMPESSGFWENSSTHGNRKCVGLKQTEHFTLNEEYCNNRKYVICEFVSV